MHFEFVKQHFGVIFYQLKCSTGEFWQVINFLLNNFSTKENNYDSINTLM